MCSISILSRDVGRVFRGNLGDVVNFFVIRSCYDKIPPRRKLRKFEVAEEDKRPCDHPNCTYKGGNAEALQKYWKDHHRLLICDMCVPPEQVSDFFYHDRYFKRIFRIWLYSLVDIDVAVRWNERTM